MTIRTLIGIVPAAIVSQLPTKLVDQKPRITIVDDLAAITLPAVGQSRLSSARRSLTARLRQLQVGLETLARTGPVLGAALDEHFKDDAEIYSFVQSNTAGLTEAMANFGSRWQFQIEIDWAPEAALKALAAKGAIDAAGKTGQALADAMQEALAEERAQLTRKMSDILTPAAAKLASLPVLEDKDVARFLVLTDSAGEAALDAAVNAVDGLAPDLFQIRYLGPLPAISFACVARNVATAASLATAAGTIGLGSITADTQEIQSAFRSHCKAMHPDTEASSGDTEADMQAAKQARDLLICAAKMRAAMGEQAPKEALQLLDLRRDANLQMIAEAA